MKKILFIFLSFLLLVPSFALAADSSAPMSFYGSAELSGNLLPAGSVIQVFVAGVLVGKATVNEGGYYNEENYAKSRLLISPYKGSELVFKYISQEEDGVSFDNTIVKYLGAFEAGKNVKLDLSFLYNVSLSFTPVIASTTSVQIATSTVLGVENKPQVLGVKVVDYSAFNSLFGLDGALTDSISENEAKTIINQNDQSGLSDDNNSIYNEIISAYSFKIDDAGKKAIAYFIQNGSPTTKRLGSGEQAGALSSFMSAFDKSPSSILDWQDVIKIANGRWPSQKSQIAEDKATLEFKKIYLRMPSMKNSNDNAAVTIMAYGLRPANRNTESEKTAIKSFKYIYGKNPVSAMEWDVVRAIAYSGAKR